MNLNGNYIALASIAAALFIAFVTTRAQKDYAWEIATRSGSLDKPALSLELGNSPLMAGADTLILFGASSISDQQKVVVGSLPFRITSSGSKDVKDISLSFIYHKIFGRQMIEDAGEQVVSGPSELAPLSKKLTSDGTSTFITYTSEALRPGLSVTISEPILLEPSEITTTVDIKSKDGVDASVDVTARLVRRFGLVVAASDAALTSYPFSLAVVRADTIEDLGSSSYVLKHIAGLRVKLRQEMGFFPYLLSAFSSRQISNIVLVYAPGRGDRIGDAEVYQYTKPPVIGHVSYALFSWDALIKKGGQF